MFCHEPCHNTHDKDKQNLNHKDRSIKKNKAKATYASSLLPCMWTSEWNGCKCVCMRVTPSWSGGWCHLSSYLFGKTAVHCGSYQSPLVYGCPTSAGIGYECQVCLCLQDGVGLATTVDFWLGSAVRTEHLDQHQPCLGFCVKFKVTYLRSGPVFGLILSMRTWDCVRVWTLLSLRDLETWALNIEKCAERGQDGASSGWQMKNKQTMRNRDRQSR